MKERTRAHLRERLQRLGTRKSAGRQRPPTTAQSAPPLDAILNGREIVTARGTFYLCEQRFDHEHVHGRYPLGRILSAPLPPLRHLLSPPNGHPCSVQRLAFLDTETLGLVGGTGTAIFLVSVGIVTEADIHVRQYFLRDLHEEPAMLEHLAHDLARWDICGLVTYNGRAFDIPLLETRFILNAIPSPLNDLAHLDLLVHTRRLWQPRLRRCSLAHVETHILDHRRDMLDVPGWLVPTLYKEYLRTRDPRPLRQIFYHNLHDTLSLIALTDILLRAWHDPWSEPALAPEDFVARAHYLLKAGEWEAAETSLRHALRHSIAPEHRRRAYASLGRLLKRQQRWKEALTVWQGWITEFPEDLPPYEELAKYYEWRAHDLPRALDWTQRALDVLARLRVPERARWEAAFHHRAARLRRRIASQRGG